MYPANTFGDAVLFLTCALQFAATERLRAIRGLPPTMARPHAPLPHLRLVPPPPLSYQVGVMTDAGKFMCLQECPTLALALQALDQLAGQMDMRLRVIELPSNTVVAIRGGP